ncbi:hypothetical protein CALCODRAFT_269641 [Calocera cornea HHB12733]|uniref:Uncharacterized protein n=1 Tax=Calocera cornea HHB12733 TaxID=1353952 RepID=A0A165G8E7_9BASI|nr:hypothetical protein CALCODRAFT_269641 [Calocera cornea HHB12733]
MPTRREVPMMSPRRGSCARPSTARFLQVSVPLPQRTSPSGKRSLWSECIASLSVFTSTQRNLPTSINTEKPQKPTPVCSLRSRKPPVRLGDSPNKLLTSETVRQGAPLSSLSRRPRRLRMEASIRHGSRLPSPSQRYIRVRATMTPLYPCLYNKRLAALDVSVVSLELSPYPHSDPRQRGGVIPAPPAILRSPSSSPPGLPCPWL